jgi:hypothetical protein
LPTAEAIVSESDRDELAQRIARLEAQDQRLTQALELLAQREAPAGRPRRDWNAYAAVIPEAERFTQ